MISRSSTLSFLPERFACSFLLEPNFTTQPSVFQPYAFPNRSEQCPKSAACTGCSTSCLCFDCFNQRRLQRLTELEKISTTFSGDLHDHGSGDWRSEALVKFQRTLDYADACKAFMKHAHSAPSSGECSQRGRDIATSPIRDSSRLCFSCSQSQNQLSNNGSCPNGNSCCKCGNRITSPGLLDVTKSPYPYNDKFRKDLISQTAASMNRCNCRNHRCLCNMNTCTLCGKSLLEMNNSKVAPPEDSSPGLVGKGVTKKKRKRKSKLKKASVRSLTSESENHPKMASTKSKDSGSLKSSSSSQKRSSSKSSGILVRSPSNLTSVDSVRKTTSSIKSSTKVSSQKNSSVKNSKLGSSGKSISSSRSSTKKTSLTNSSGSVTSTKSPSPKSSMKSSLKSGSNSVKSSGGVGTSKGSLSSSTSSTRKPKTDSNSSRSKKGSSLKFSAKSDKNDSEVDEIESGGRTDFSTDLDSSPIAASESSKESPQNSPIYGVTEADEQGDDSSSYYEDEFEDEEGVDDIETLSTLSTDSDLRLSDGRPKKVRFSSRIDTLENNSSGMTTADNTGNSAEQDLGEFSGEDFVQQEQFSGRGTDDLYFDPLTTSPTTSTSTPQLSQSASSNDASGASNFEESDFEDSIADFTSPINSQGDLGERGDPPMLEDGPVTLRNPPGESEDEQDTTTESRFVVRSHSSTAPSSTHENIRSSSRLSDRNERHDFSSAPNFATDDEIRFSQRPESELNESIAKSGSVSHVAESNNTPGSTAQEQRVKVLRR